MSTFRETLHARIAAWKAEHNVKLCPKAKRDEIEAALRQEWGPVQGGFAHFTPEQRRAIAAKGGRAARDSGKAHRFTPETGRAAGALGGATAHQLGKAHRFTPEEARAANQVAKRSGAPTKTKWVYGIGEADQPPGPGATMYTLCRLAIETVSASGFSLWRAPDPKGGESPEWIFQRRIRLPKG